MPVIQVKNLFKKYNNFVAVNNISFDIQEKEIFGLLGPNGAGKTTTISMLSSYLLPDSGEIKIYNKDVVKNSFEVKKIIGVVPQEIALYSTLSAEENLSFFGKIYKINKKGLKNKIKDLLNLVGLYKRRKELIKTYSGGMKRRINIAVGLLNEPKFLMLDEPTVGVDPQSREHIFETIFKIKSRGTTILYTTHYMEEAEKLCDRIAIIDQGKIIAIGSLKELLSLFGEGDVIEVKTERKIKELDKLKELTDNFKQEDNILRISTKEKTKILTELSKFLSENDYKILDLEIYSPNLEKLFIHLTGKKLRD